ncbi:radical SAM protein [uncultured Duncaniella sp.]|jgi:uncharacterized protein|nr:radical SAM protein [uncultured Duncaniella sp.]
MDLRDNKISCEDLDDDTKALLSENKIITDSDDTELAKLKLLKHYHRMDNSIMALTIAPTLECNLRCSYCFEQTHPNIRMSDEVEDAIVDFIKQHSSVWNLQVTWFGGEPLLYFDRIESLTKKILSIQTIKNYKAEIVTNGVGFNAEIISKLIELHIDSVFVTLDGLEDTHNARRGEINGLNSYKSIMRNLELLSKIPEITKVIRVNIDATNMNSFCDVFEHIKQKFKSDRFMVYAGFIKSSYGCNNQCVNAMTSHDQAKYLVESYKKLGADAPSLLPVRNSYECIARCKNGILIDPEGFLYKCWSDTGYKKMSFGNVKDISNLNLDILSQYMVGNDPFDDINCQVCPFLPICGGGCPHSRVMNRFYGAKNEVCHYAKTHTRAFIESFYELKILKESPKSL